MVKNIKGVKIEMEKKRQASRVKKAKSIVANVKSRNTFIAQAEKTANRLYGVFEEATKTYTEKELKSITGSLEKMLKCVNKRYSNALKDLGHGISMELPNSKMISQIEDLSGLHSKLAMLRVQADASLGETVIDSTGFVVDMETVAEEIDATIEADGTDEIATDGDAIEGIATEEVATEDTATEEVAIEDIATEDDKETEEVATDDIAIDDIATDDIATDDIANDEVATEEVATDEIVAEEELEEEIDEENNIESEEEVEDLDDLSGEEDESLSLEDEDTNIEDIELEDVGIDDMVNEEILNEEDMNVLDEEEEEEVTSTAKIKAKKLKTAKKTGNHVNKEDNLISQLFEDMVV